MDKRELAEEGNELDSTYGLSDDELTRRFIEAVRIENEIKRIKGVPICGYDKERKSSYLEYPDGKREYRDENGEPYFVYPKKMKTGVTHQKMKIFPAIDIKDGQCVRLVKGDYATAHKVAEDPLATARSFEAAGAEWIHMVDLDGAKDAALVNKDIFVRVAKETGLKVEVGGGIRTMEAVDYYLSHCISRVILGSAAVKNPAFAKEAAAKYGEKIAIGIDAREGMVAAEGWLDTSDVYFVDLAKEMEKIGVKTIIFTDISRDGTLSGPNLDQLREINSAVSCDIIASGGVSGIDDIIALRNEGLYGAIAGKAVYTGALDVAEAIAEGAKPRDLSRYFTKSELIPAIVQEASTGEVLMLAYMNEESLRLTLETGVTWFWSRSRQELWNKGATSGHYQYIVSVSGDCDDDTLLIRVNQVGAACHTGNHSCFFNAIGFKPYRGE